MKIGKIFGEFGKMNYLVLTAAGSVINMEKITEMYIVRFKNEFRVKYVIDGRYIAITRFSSKKGALDEIRRLYKIIETRWELLHGRTKKPAIENKSEPPAVLCPSFTEPSAPPLPPTRAEPDTEPPTELGPEGCARIAQKSMISKMKISFI